MQTYYSKTLNKRVTVPEPDITLTVKDMRCLERLEIITLQGISGKFATVDQAVQAPQLIQAHSSAGVTYSVAFDNGIFTLEPNYAN